MFHQLLLIFSKFFKFLNPFIAIFYYIKYSKLRSVSKLQYKMFIDTVLNYSQYTLSTIHNYAEKGLDSLRKMGLKWIPDGRYSFSDWYPYHPWIIFARKGDDCDGFANLHYRVLKKIIKCKKIKKETTLKRIKVNKYVLFCENKINMAHMITVLTIMREEENCIKIECYLFDNLSYIVHTHNYTFTKYTPMVGLKRAEKLCIRNALMKTYKINEYNYIKY